jgi:hypothetical protein
MKRVIDRAYVLSEDELKVAVIEWLKGQGLPVPKPMDRDGVGWCFEFAGQPCCTVHWQERDMLTGKPEGNR